MKPTIHDSRRGSRATCFLWSLVLLALVFMAGNSARATETYSYSGSHSLTWTTNTYKTLAIHRTGGYDSLMVFESLSGSSKFSIEQPYFVSWGDTTNDSAWQYDSTRYIYISFSSSIADTSNATLVIHDSHHSDTITLTGIGTDDRVDYTYSLINDRPDTSRAGTEIVYIYYTPDSGTTASLDGIIYNHRTSPIDVLMSVDDSTYWSVDGQGGQDDLSLNGTSDHTSGRTFAITYTPHGVYLDSVEATISCTSPYSQGSKIMIYVIDSRYAPTYYIPMVIAPNLGTVANDSTKCETVYISDSTAQDITITSITVGNNDGWTSSDMPSLPFTLSAWGGNKSFTICFSPGKQYFGQSVSDYVTVTYADSSDLKGSVTGYVYAQTQSCIQEISDSIKLDEVLFGGYVDAQATFVFHADSVLRGITGEVLPIGGSVQILSPTLPMNVHNGDTVTFSFRVKPDGEADSAENYYSYYGYYLMYLGECSAEINFTGAVTGETNSTLDLFQNETGLLALTTSDNTTIDTFWFDNNESGQVIVNGVSLSQGTNFSILGELPHALNDTLSSGHLMGVIVKFDGDTNGFYHDSLTITTELSATHKKDEISSNTTKHVFNLEALHTQGAAGVAQPIAVSAATISIVPNPASGPVMISVNEAAKAEIEVFDLLGNRILNAPQMGSNAYEWNESGMANGIYIVRATGVDANGTSFVISKRMVLNK